MILCVQLFQAEQRLQRSQQQLKDLRQAAADANPESKYPCLQDSVCGIFKGTVQLTVICWDPVIILIHKVSLCKVPQLIWFDLKLSVYSYLVLGFLIQGEIYTFALSKFNH